MTHNVHALKTLNLSDYVMDTEPSTFLRCTMSRSVKLLDISEVKLLPFLRNILTLNNKPADVEILQIQYGSSGRRTILIALAHLESARILKETLHGKSCSLIHGRMLYVSYAIHLKDKEKRERIKCIQPVTRELGDASNAVEGLIYLREYISKSQEHEILSLLDMDGRKLWKHTIKARQVQHFGYEFDYTTRMCDIQCPLQSALPPLLESLARGIPLAVTKDAALSAGMAKIESTEWKPIVFDQVTANEYAPGQGIASHIDTHSAFTGAIASLSLLNETVMEFTHPNGLCIPILLEPRSVLILTGASRYEWNHAIPPRKMDKIDGELVQRKRRVSITFRRLNESACSCEYPMQCDRTSSDPAVFNKVRQVEEYSRAPTALEKLYVHQFYDQAAHHFSSTRYAPWPKVAQFLKNLGTGLIIADIGCGNGKYMKIMRNLENVCFGGDRSTELVAICNSQRLSVCLMDAVSVPIRSNSCDAALSIAVLHHLSTEEHRFLAVSELVRVLHVGGQGLVYAWAHEQHETSRRQFDPSRQDFMVPWNLDRRFQKSSDENTKVSEDNAPPVLLQRFCHMFRKNELSALLEQTEKVLIVESYYDESNWAVLFQKIKN